jgi:hypothetical protein
MRKLLAPPTVQRLLAPVPGVSRVPLAPAQENEEILNLILTFLGIVRKFSGI